MFSWNKKGTSCCQEEGGCIFETSIEALYILFWNLSNWLYLLQISDRTDLEKKAFSKMFQKHKG